MPSWLTPELRSQLTDGVLLTVGLTAVTSIASVVLGLFAALGRSSIQRVTRMVAGAFVETFRNVPALILIIFFAFAVPNVFSADTRRRLFFDNGVVDAVSEITGLSIPYYAVAAATALALNTGAHLGEIFRSGFASVSVSQVAAARSLGASHRSALRDVVVPAGVRVSFPAMTNRLVHNMKNTSLASFVAVPELFGVIQGAITRTFEATELLLFAAAMYLVLSSLMTAGLNLVGRYLWAKPSSEAGRV